MVIQGTSIYEITPPTGVQNCFRGKPPKLWGYGNPAMLDRPLLGIISARQNEPDLALKSAQLVQQLASLKEVAFISGWHSPLEQESLRVLVSQEVCFVFCLSKALDHFKPSGECEKLLSQSNALLLTHCSPKAKRISRGASIRRNELVIGLAVVLLVLSAPEGSASLTLARAALRFQKPVFTLEHRMNKELLDDAALPAKFDDIRAALG